MICCQTLIDTNAPSKSILTLRINQNLFHDKYEKKMRDTIQKNQLGVDGHSAVQQK